MATKNAVIGVFDSLASKKSWESLYSGKPDRLSYNFVTRQRAVQELLDSRVTGKVIDLGCGTGDLVPFYLSKKIQYFGLDVSEKMIERASSLFKDQGSPGQIQFLVGDCEKLPFKNSEFDTLSAVALLEYFPKPDQALNEISRVLKTGGYALVTVPHKSCINFKIRDVLAPIRELLYPLYLKRKGGPLSAMKKVKHYHYDPAELDALMRSRGFEVCARKFSNFYVIPHPLDHLVPKLYMRLSELTDRSSKSESLRFLAANYIGLYKKVN